MKITLVRHTEVDERYHEKYNGHIDIGLSERGVNQAKELASFFKTHHFDLVYCSDLKRAKDTLKPFKQECKAIYTELLREKSWGKHEGLSFDEIIAQGEIEYKDFLQWINALGGEGYKLYTIRVRKFFLEYLDRLEAKSILVITHGGVIRVLIAIVQNLPLEDAFSIDVPYSAYTIFDTDSMSFSEVKYNNC